MLKRVLFHLGAIALTLLPLLSLRAEITTAPGAAVKAAPSYTYLTGQEKVWDDFPKTPALGSSIDLLDLSIVLSAQASRTEAQKAVALHDQKYNISLVSDVIDSAFATKYPETFKVLTAVGTDAYLLNTKLKKLNARPRPYVQHPTLVTPLLPVVDWSYPSGHACGSMIQALVLGKLFPSQAEALLKRARECADSRVVAGVHNPSDIAAGQNLSALIFKERGRNPRFLKDLAAAAAKDQIPVPTPSS